jgi:hypothetical protein
MIVVAGPPGGGKSSIFPVSSFGVSCFNADDRAAEMNGGSYLGIPKRIRQAVNRKFKLFVLDCIGRRTSFAIETALRSGVTFEQATLAKAGLCKRDALSRLTRFSDARRAGQSTSGRWRPQRL